MAKTHTKQKRNPLLPYHTPYYLVGVVEAAVVPVRVLERAFVVGGEVVAATSALAGRGRELNQISAIDPETGPAEERCQSEGAVEPLGEHAFGFRVKCLLLFA